MAQTKISTELAVPITCLCFHLGAIVCSDNTLLTQCPRRGFIVTRADADAYAYADADAYTSTT